MRKTKRKAKTKNKRRPEKIDKFPKLLHMCRLLAVMMVTFLC